MKEDRIGRMQAAKRRALGAEASLPLPAEPTLTDRIAEAYRRRWGRWLDDEAESGSVPQEPRVTRRRMREE